MKRTVIRALACLLALLAVPSALFAFAFFLPPQYEEPFLGELKYKCDLLEETPGPRIVTVGGSGVAFGQRSDLLEEALPGWSAVNFGMYAGLGSTVMLDLARPRLRTGDIVIFSPEQSEQTLSGYFNAEAMWQAADGRPALLGALSGEDLGAMAGWFPYFAARKAHFFLEKNMPRGEGVYSRAAFNGRGDIEYADRSQNIMPGGLDPNMPISFDTTLPTEEFLDYVRDYAQECARRGILFYYRFCPMNALAVSEKELERLSSYQVYLENRLSCEILGDPRDAILDEGWFYDTNFHLNSAGAVVNTAALATSLRSVLGEPGAVKIALPEKPPLAKAVAVSGSDADADCFHYETVGGEAYLTGLTAEGALRERIALPTRWGGLPVVGFAAQVFAGNRVIREIVVQANIRGMKNGSFDGCTALERLVITNPSPSACSVGEGLLVGTQANIYVPGESLGTYLTNYFWSVHATRIHASPDGPSMPAISSAPALQPEKSGPLVRYDGNGGTRTDGAGAVLELPMDNARLRSNTAQGSNHFRREGYVLTGWNTQADGGGVHIGLGSRVDKQEGLTLYAQWEKENPTEDFLYETVKGEVRITGYRGSGELCVVPQSIEGLPVRRICTGAFRNAEFKTLVLSPAMFAMEPEALVDSAVESIFLYDTLRYISDESFGGCGQLTTLHVNAATSPVYSGTYFDTFSDKYDWLLSIQDEKKIVLFSGSSARYGYDSPALRAAFPEYQVANMGVYAYTNALPQLMIILDLMEEEDILLSAPEFDTVHNQFCTKNSIDPHFWAMMESNYDAAAVLDLREYSGVFTSFAAYLATRSGMVPKSYSVTPNGCDDDGNHYKFDTYNQYGDFTLPRPNGAWDILLQNDRANYTTIPFPDETLESLNRVYRRFLEAGVEVYFTYTPRNRSSLTYESTPEARHALHERLTEGLCVPVISDIEDYLYSGKYFYLIDSHLSDEGVNLRTRQLISDLDAWMTQSYPR